MDKQEFDSLFVEHVSSPLLGLGFRQKGKSLFREAGWSTLALLAEPAPGFASFVLGLRHAFVRIYATEAQPMFGPTASEDYPFIVPIAALTPHNMGLTGPPFTIPAFDSLEALEKDPGFTSATSLQAIDWRSSSPGLVVAQLREVARRVRAVGVPWADSVTPEVAVVFLEARNSTMHQDLFWLAEYRRFVEAARK